MKKMKKKLILIISLILVLIILITIVLYYNNRITLPENLDNFFNQEKQNQNNKDNAENNNINQNIPDNNQQTVGGSTEGSSESQTASQNTNPSNSFCYNKQASYSIGNINEYYFCNSVESNLCIDKTAKCSVKVQNLDATISGNFEIKFSFFEKENRSNIIETSSSNSFIAPNEEKILKAELVIQGNNANKNLSCYYSTTEVPNKKVCY